MSLAFAATTDIVNCGTATMLDDLLTGTYLAWVYPTTVAAATDQRIIQKGLAASGARIFYFDGTLAGTVGIEVHGGSTTLQYTSAANTIKINQWQCLAGVHDYNNNIGHLYRGTLNSPLVELAYSVTQNGIGAPGTNAGVAQTVGNKSNNSAAFQGSIALAMIWNRVLSVGELLKQQFSPSPSGGCLLFVHLGGTAAGTQLDMTGNGNNGSITGAKVASDLPRDVFRWARQF